MSNFAVHFSSARQDWATPWDLFKVLNAEYGPFDLDVCATPEKTKCAAFYTPKDNGLTRPWTGRCWMNPPYGREIGKWVKKAAHEAQTNSEIVVCLLPARTDTAWWHDFVEEVATKVLFIRGRIKFVGAKNSAPFPSAVVVFKNSNQEGDR